MTATKFYNQGLLSVVALKILSGKRTEISAAFRNPENNKFSFWPAVQKVPSKKWIKMKMLKHWLPLRR